MNPLDLIFLSVFEGKINPKCIGYEVELRANEYYEEIWRGDDVNLNYPERGLEGKLNFILYKRKDNHSDI